MYDIFEFFHKIDKGSAIVLVIYYSLFSVADQVLAKFGSRFLYLELWEIFKILLNVYLISQIDRRLLQALDPGWFSGSKTSIERLTQKYKKKACKVSRKFIQWHFKYLLQLRTYSFGSVGSATLIKFQVLEAIESVNSEDEGQGEVDGLDLSKENIQLYMNLLAFK